MRIGSNVRIPGDLHHKNIVLAFLKKIEMVKIAMPNFCINFLNKTVKSLSILRDFAVASFVGAWIKIQLCPYLPAPYLVASLADAWIKMARKRKETEGERSHPSRMRGLKYLQNCYNPVL
ncbi:hypothetical protein DXD91_14305 [Anaerobutyricum hallii]|uniref:Uncharacterized protein n=1 Tax=Anaerobutyricum hallii TaxID=39488 RepID=A0A374N821_9FIRM|nr:hypothetical protein DXD91_14305 [Anaerobutyricum hallii]